MSKLCFVRYEYQSYDPGAEPQAAPPLVGYREVIPWFAHPIERGRDEIRAYYYRGLDDSFTIEFKCYEDCEVSDLCEELQIVIEREDIKAVLDAGGLICPHFVIASSPTFRMPAPSDPICEEMITAANLGCRASAQRGK